MNTLVNYVQNPDVQLPFDVPDRLGLDATGRDGDDRFPYTWGSLTPAEQATAATTRHTNHPTSLSA